MQNPHELTQAEFIGVASVRRLENHGRKWIVELGTYACFSDAETSNAAVIDAHHIAVNNAIYLNSPDGRNALPELPSLPTSTVLADYPDLQAMLEAYKLQVTYLNPLNHNKRHVLIDKLDLDTAEEVFAKFNDRSQTPTFLPGLKIEVMA